MDRAWAGRRDRRLGGLDRHAEQIGVGARLSIAAQLGVRLHVAALLAACITFDLTTAWFISQVSWQLALYFVMP